MQLRQGPYGRGGFSAAAGLSLTAARLDMHNGYRDRASFEHLLCQNCEADIDVNIENMSADSFEIGSSLTGRVALSLHVSADDDIRGRQPLVFASSGSFAANRESFKVKKVYGSPYMFDILYKEEDGGLKKSWSLVMNDTPNPDYRPAADTPAESTPDPETAKDTAPEKEKTDMPPAAEKSVSQTMPDCRGNPGCLFFKALNRATSVIYLIIAGTHKITDTTLTAIETPSAALWSG